MEDTQTTTTEQVQPQTESVQTETTQVQTPVQETTQTTETVQEPIKPFELPKENNPISFEKPDDIVKAYKGDKKALLKELGLDDFMLSAYDYYKATGNLADYAEVKSVDWTKVPVEKVAEEMLREQYSKTGLSEDKIQKLIQRDLRNKYMLGDEHDSESEDVQIARIQMEADANLYRQQRIERQNQFKAPERVVEETTPMPSVEEQIEAARQYLLQDQNVQKLLTEKQLGFGEYNYGIENPQDLLQVVYDQNRWQYELAQKTPDGKVVMKDGQPIMDNSKMLLAAAFVTNPKKIIDNLIAYGKSLGQKELVDEAEHVNNNASKGAEVVTEDLETRIAKAIMSRGK